MNESALRSRIEALLKLCDVNHESKTDWVALGNEAFLGTLTVLESVYGSGSDQVATLHKSYKDAMAAESRGDHSWRIMRAIPVLRGALRNVLAE